MVGIDSVFYISSNIHVGLILGVNTRPNAILCNGACDVTLDGDTVLVGFREAEWEEKLL